MSRKYRVLAIFVIVIIIFCYVAEYLMEQVAIGVKKRHPRARFQQAAPASPTLMSTNTTATPVVGRRFR
ncbi:MAG: hypothetical protein ABSC38_06275 [Verrucomicrobiia bacterium]